MIIQSFSSVILVLLSSTAIYKLSGGAGIPFFFLNPVLFAVLLLAAVLVLAVSGTLKDFAVLFLPAKKTAAVSLSGLKNAYDSVGLVISAELILSIGIACTAAVVLLYNWNRLDYIGPNLAASIEAPLCALILILILLPLQTGLKRRLVLFMEETEDTEVPVSRKKNEKRYILLKTAAGTGSFILICACVYYVILKNDKNIPLPFDMPNLITLAVFTGIALGCSGTVRSFMHIFTVSSSDASPAVLNQLADTVELIIKILLCAGLLSALISAEVILSALQETAYLVPNIYVALLGILYAAVFSLVLLPVRMSLKKRAAQRICTYGQN